MFFNDLVYDETKHYSKHNRQLLINCLFDFIFKDIVNKHLTQDNVREARQYMEIERKNFLKFCELEYGPSTLPKTKCQRINNDDGDDIIKQTSSESTPNETIDDGQIKNVKDLIIVPSGSESINDSVIKYNSREAKIKRKLKREGLD